MSQRDDVLRILAEHPDGMSDAEVAAELRRDHPRVVHQTANMICRALAADRLVVRATVAGRIVNRLVGVAPPPRPSVDPVPAQPWPWEGAVQRMVVDELAHRGAAIESQADTAARERGTDVVAVLDGRRVHVEVKGWPGREYADPRRAGETKRTQPTVQAAQWFAGALSSALKLRQAHPHDRVVVAFPDFPRYRTLHVERAHPLRLLGIEVWFVAESASVEKAGSVELPDQVVATDTAAQRRHRVHQSWWRREVLGLPAGPPAAQVRHRYPTLGNYLPESHDGQSAAAAGWNLMSDAARTYTRERLAVLGRTGGLAEPDRLWRNMLSSQPLAFSIAGHLRAHPAAAVAMFAELTGWPVTALDALGDVGDDHRLDGIEAEWNPPRDDHTRDRSGFDLVALLSLDDGARALLSVEVKYVDSFSPSPLEPKWYADHLSASGIDEEAVSAIVDAGASQFLRSVLLTESVRRHGLRGETGIDRALSVVLARDDDPAADNAVRVLQEHVPRVATARWGHTALLTAAGRRAELAEWARQMLRRYTPCSASTDHPAAESHIHAVGPTTASRSV